MSNKVTFKPVVSYYFAPELSINDGRLMRISYGYEYIGSIPTQLVLKMNLVDAKTRQVGHLGRTVPSFTAQDMSNLQDAIDALTDWLNEHEGAILYGIDNVELN